MHSTDPENQFKKEFVDAMNRLAEAFPGVNNKSRMKRNFHYVSNLPIEALNEIIDDLLDSCKSTPLPNDFDKAAKEWRKRFFLENGYYYGFEPKEKVDLDVECFTCYDTGILKIKHHNPDSFSQLMRCNCECGKKSTVKIPHWDNELNSVFTKNAIDPKFFNPNILETDSPGGADEKLWAKVSEWKSVLRKSEKYWADLSYKGGNQ